MLDVLTKARVANRNAALQHSHALMGLGLACAAASGAMLYIFPPDRFRFYPPCPIHLVSGLLCPGCGATHALVALLHGDLSAAWRDNALLILLLPVLLFYGASAWRYAWRGQPPPAVPNTTLAGCFFATAIFTIGRNLS